MESPPLPIWERRVLWFVALFAVVGFAALYERFYDAPIRAALARRRAARRTPKHATPEFAPQPRAEVADRRGPSALVGVSRAQSN
jgi:peptidoglycan/LPS O-acetylase OafA/YrhL